MKGRVFLIAFPREAAERRAVQLRAAGWEVEIVPPRGDQLGRVGAREGAAGRAQPRETQLGGKGAGSRPGFESATTMTGALPEWHAFDFNAGVLPAGIEALMAAAESGSVIVFAPTPGAQADDWAPRAVATVAASWADRGGRVVLADVGLENPRLHDVLGEENGEGIADAVLFGASVARIMTAVVGGSFFFVPAGTYPADPEAVLRHERWDFLIRGLAQAGSIVLLYLPLDLAGFGAVAARAWRIVLMARRDENAGANLPEPVVDRVVALLGPPVDEGVAAAPRAPETAAVTEAAGWGLRLEGVELAALEPEGVEGVRAAEAVGLEGLELVPLEPEPAGAGGAAVEALGVAPLEPDEEETPAVERFGFVPLEPVEEGVAAHASGIEPLEMEPAFPGPQGARGVEREAALPAGTRVPSPPPGAPRFKVAVAEEQPKRAAKRERAVRGGPSPVMLVGLLVALGAALWYYGIEGAPLPFLEQAGAPEGEAAVSLPVVSRARPLPYSAAVGAYGTLERARARVDALAAAHPEATLFIVPILVDGRLLFRVLAGASPDAAGAGAEGERIAPGEWEVSEAALAFDFGEFRERAGAEARVAELAGREVPAYIVRVPYSDGSERYRVYAGGYESAEAAAALRELLQRNGIDVPLVRRAGAIPE